MKKLNKIKKGIVCSVFSISTLQLSYAAGENVMLGQLHNDLQGIQKSQDTIVDSVQANYLSTQSLKDQFNKVGNLPTTAVIPKFIEYLDEKSQDQSQGKGQEDSSIDLRSYINDKKNLPNNDYLMSLVQGKNYAGEQDNNLVVMGSQATLIAQSAVLVNSVLSKINANEVNSEKLLAAIKTLSDSNNLKMFHRDELLRNIALQLSVNNLISYQRLEAQNLSSLLKVAEIMNSNVKINQWNSDLEGNDSDDRISLYKQLANMNDKLDTINQSIAKLQSKS